MENVKFYDFVNNSFVNDFIVDYVSSSNTIINYTMFDYF